MKQFNINKSVSFRLSKRGAEVANEHWNKYRDIFGDKTPTFKPGDIWKGPMWEAFEIFGNVMSLTNESPMWDCSIFFDDNDLNDTKSIKAFEKKYDRR